MLIRNHIPDPGKKLTLLLLFTSLVASCLVVFRYYLTGNITYTFLIWNLFLAWIPFIFSTILSWYVARSPRWYIMLFLFVTWLLFFPNAPYILTDLVHLKERYDIAYWYDFLVLIFFCFNSLFLGFASLIQVKRIGDRYFPQVINHIFVLCILILTSFGIYLVRFERYNTWDVITNPFALSKDIYNLLVNAKNEKQVIYIVFFLSLFLVINYFTVLLLQEYSQPKKEVNDE